MKVGDIIKLMDELYIVSEVKGQYAELIHCKTLSPGRSIVNNPYVEVISESR